MIYLAFGFAALAVMFAALWFDACRRLAPLLNENEYLNWKVRMYRAGKF